MKSTLPVAGAIALVLLWQAAASAAPDARPAGAAPLELSVACDALRRAGSDVAERDPYVSGLSRELRLACGQWLDAESTDATDAAPLLVATRGQQQQVLAALVALGVVPASSVAPPPPGGLPGLQQHVERVLPSARALEGGYVQTIVVRRTLDALCSDDVRRRLPRACASGERSDGSALQALRAGLVADAIELPGRLAEQAAEGTQARPQLALVQVAVDALLRGLRADELARAVTVRSAPVGRALERAFADTRTLIALAGASGAGDDRVVAHARGKAALLATGVLAELRDGGRDARLGELLGALGAAARERAEVLTRLHAELESLDAAAVDQRGAIEAEIAARRAQAEAAVGQVRDALRAPVAGVTPSARQRAAAQELATASVRLWLLLRAEGAGLSGPVVGRALSLCLEVLDASHHLALDAPLWTPELASTRSLIVTAVVASASADMRALERAMVKLVGEAASGVDDPAAIASSARGLFRLAQARNVDEVKAAARGALVDLGPWADDVVASAHLGAVSLPDEDGDFRFAGELTLGYAPRSWGLVGKGYGNSFALTGATRRRDTRRWGGNLEAWLATRPAPTRLEGRAAYEGEWLSTHNSRLGDVVGGDGDGLPNYFDETHWFNRLMLLVALRVEPSPVLGLVASAGGGAQLERYHSTRVNDPDTPGVNVRILDESQLSGSGEARLHGYWSFWPQVLSLRVSSETLATGISTDAATVDVVAGAGATASTERGTGLRLETMDRIFLDLDLLALAGFVPGLATGFDYVVVDDGEEVVSSLNPMIQLGIRRLDSP